MASLVQPVRGINDVLPSAADSWRFVESTAHQLLERYGYEQIRTPVIERTELFKRSIGEATDIVEKEMYTFDDRNGDSLTLRPEATAGVVRAGLSHGLFHNQQQKLWCSGPMFRHEKPQKARYRQFHQLSVEAIGYAGADLDAELIALSARLWRRLGLTSPRLELNSLGTAAARQTYRDELVEYFSAHGQGLDADSRRRLETNPLRILDSKNPEMADVIAAAPLLTEFLDTESRDHFDELKAMLSAAGIDFVLNPRLVRGLDYYSRTVFEWVTDRLGAQGAICSGGRYDGLISQLGGRDTPASGWALGFERVVELLEAEACAIPEQQPDAYLVAVGDAARQHGFALAETLRDRVTELWLSMDCTGGGIKAQLKRADKSGARYALILGEDEVRESRVAVKPLRTDDPQTSLELDALVALLQRDAG